MGIKHWTSTAYKEILKAAPGFEPGDQGFAILCLTTWLCRHSYKALYSAQSVVYMKLPGLCSALPHFQACGRREESEALSPRLASTIALLGKTFPGTDG